MRSMGKAGRPQLYRTDAECLLMCMLECIDPDTNSISRYMVRTRAGARMKAGKMDQLISELGITEHTRKDQWRGRFYEPREVAEKLLMLRKELDEKDQREVQHQLETLSAMEEETPKPW